MKAIIFIALMLSNTSTTYSSEIIVAENIEYLEYCYRTEQCEVPEKYKNTIKQNFIKINSGKSNLY